MTPTAQRIVEVIAQLDEVKNELNRGGEPTAAGHVRRTRRAFHCVRSARGSRGAAEGAGAGAGGAVAVIHFDDFGRMCCSLCKAVLRIPLPMRVTTLAIVGEAFTAEHEGCNRSCSPDYQRSLLDILVDHGIRCFEAGDAWQTAEEVHDFMRAVAEVAKVER